MKFQAIFIVMMLNLSFTEDPGVILKDYSSIKNEKTIQNNVRKVSMLKIVKVEPTVLFRNDQNGLMQAVDIIINNSGQTADVRLQVRFRSHDELSIDLGTVNAGEDTL